MPTISLWLTTPIITVTEKKQKEAQGKKQVDYDKEMNQDKKKLPLF